MLHTFAAKVRVKRRTSMKSLEPYTMSVLTNPGLRLLTVTPGREEGVMKIKRQDP